MFLQPNHLSLCLLLHSSTNKLIRLQNTVTSLEEITLLERQLALASSVCLLVCLLHNDSCASVEGWIDHYACWYLASWCALSSETRPPLEQLWRLKQKKTINKNIIKKYNKHTLEEDWKQLTQCFGFCNYGSISHLSIWSFHSKDFSSVSVFSLKTFLRLKNLQITISLFA